jgi:tRNA 2-thiocytidine biosynthesis protein TtcA
MIQRHVGIDTHEERHIVMKALSGKLFKKIKRLTGSAIGDFDLIEEGDHIAVAVSGGKDSYVLLHLLEALRRRAPVNFRLTAVNIDIGFPGYRSDIIEEHLRECGFEYRMVPTECFRIIEQKLTPGTSFCSFCARLRRGVLYRQAQELGCNKIALGHHLDDFIETLLLNQFFTGTLAAMSASMLADNGVTTVIRPLVYVEEKNIANFAAESGFPIVACSCPPDVRTDANRRRMKELLTQLQNEFPGIKHSMISSLGKVQPRHLLDKTLRRS